MSRDLEKLIKILRKNNVLYYKSADLELKLDETPTKAPRARRDLKEESKIKKQDLDNITEDVLSDLLISNPLEYERLYAELTTREAS
jgi:hypothetical protein